ncbi:carbamoyltransferase family protein [Methylolobus aquaticus]
MSGGTLYIGLSVTYHDPALALLGPDGDVLYAEATERCLQYKRALNAEPDNLSYLPEVLSGLAIEPERICLALNWRRRRPLYEQAVAALGILRADGLLRTGIKPLRSPLPNYKLHHMMACQRNAITKAGLNAVRLLRERWPKVPVRIVDFDHHHTHAASACFASPFEEAACAVVDSYGERGALAFFRYRGGRLERIHEARGLGSLGLFYMKLTEWCGFDWLHGEEWKVMGLAAYGQLDPDFHRLLGNSIRIDGLNVRHDSAALGAALARLNGRSVSELRSKAADLAHTGQQVFAERMSELLTNLHRRLPSDSLALAGGCALNSSFNGQILERTPFRRLYVPPAPADDGTALGAAYLARASDGLVGRPRGAALSPYLGARMSGETLERLARHAAGLRVQRFRETIAWETARRIADGRLVGWVQGRAEFGPRALGNRSILADPRAAGMKDWINGRVKFREEYRPFAPSILDEHGPEYFLDYQPSPYMERTLRFRPEARDRVPAVVHVDGTGRLQSVTGDSNPRFHALLEAFRALTGIPLLLNTSFNVMGKPIVHSVEDAVSVFMTTGLDVLVIEDFMFEKP